MEPNQENQPAQQTQPQPSAPSSTAKVVAQNLKIMGVNLLKKFYANKKVFWPVTISFGLIFLMLIVGLIFGNRQQTQKPLPTITPTPFIQATPIPSPKAPELQSAGDRLEDYRDKIDNWDTKQSELRPLNYKFDIRF